MELPAREVWEILQTPDKLTDPAKVAAILSSLGICNGKDLFFCEPAELMEIAECIKKVPQRRFYQVFGLNTEVDKPPTDV